MPNFLIIGAAKSGTTSLHYYMDQHPEIYMSPRKDTFFFNFDGRQPDYGGPGDNEWYRDFAVIDRNEYEALFEGVTDEKAVGEACAKYLYDPQAAKRIHDYIPDTKLIAILRNPVDRAFSSYMQQIRDGLETVDDFGEALKLEASRIRQNWRPIWHYRTRGLYYGQLQTYLRLFGSAQIRIYLYEDLMHNPLSMLKELFQFLGVDDQFTPDTSMRHNVSGIPRSRLLRNLIMKPNRLKSVVKPLLPRNIRSGIKSALTANSINMKKPEILTETRAKLTDAYRNDVLKVQSLIQRDLSSWLT